MSGLIFQIRSSDLTPSFEECISITGQEIARGIYMAR